mgnify:CR=1 FL=1
MNLRDIKIFDKNLNPQINDFENCFFEEFNQKEIQNILILNPNKDWIITFEKNTEDQFDLSDMKKLNDFNKFALKKMKIFTRYIPKIFLKKKTIQ